MPKPTKVETEPEVEIKPSEIKPVDQVNIEIDEKTGKPVAEVEAPKQTEDEVSKLRNQFFYELRQSEKRQREAIEQYLQRISTPVKPEKSNQEFDEIDQLAEQDWKKAVAKLAEKEAERKLEAYKEQQKKENEERQIKEVALYQEERSKQRVLKEFPDLLDESSSTFKNYMDIFNREAMEDPSFLANPRKHEIVASQLRSNGHTVNPEVERLKRVNASGYTTTRNVQPGKRIELTQEEIDLCDKSGIPYATYAQNRDLLKKGGFKEGVELKS